MRFLPLLTILSLPSLVLPLAASPNSVDTGFAATAGQVFDPSDFGGVASVLVQPDGKILFGSNEMSATIGGAPLRVPLIRFNPDGSVDNTFFADNHATGGGTGIYSDGDGWPEVHALGLLSDGKIIAAGVMRGMRDGTNSLASRCIVRINPNGTLDTTFQTAGTTAWPTGGLNYIEDVTIQPDDKTIAVGGFGGVYDVNFNWAVRYGIARFNLDGSLDAGFQLNPQEFGVPAGASNTRGYFSQASLAADGKIYVAGYLEWGPAFSPSGTAHVLARLFPNGARDLSFAPSIPADIYQWRGIVVEPAGSVVVMGRVGTSASNVPYLTRLNADGGAAGSFSLASGLGSFDARPLQLDTAGRILIGNGETLRRLLPDGSLDASFTANGDWVSNASRQAYFGTATTGPDGKIYAGSFFDTVNGVSTVKLVAFEGDAVLDRFVWRQLAPVIAENGGTLLLAVERQGPAAAAGSVTYATGSGSATPGADFNGVTGTLTWAAGERGAKLISIPILDNAANDGSRSFPVSLSSPSGASLGMPDTVIVNILDDEAPPSITADPAGGSVDQGDSFTFSVKISSAVAASIQWQFDNGSGFADIPGAVGPSYTLTSADPAQHAGSYRVVVTTSGASATSSAASLIVETPPGSVLSSNFPALTQVPTHGAIDPFGNTVLLGSSGAVRILPNGTLDSSFNVTTNSTATGLIALSDGKYLISGFFSTVNGTTRRGVARLNADGTLDTAFNLNLNYAVQSIALGSGGTIYVGGTAGNVLRRYSSAGVLDSGFTATSIGTGNPNGYVWAVRELADGKVLVSYQNGSGFSSVYYFSRLLATGAVDATFTSPQMNWNINAFDLLPDGRIIVGGRFSTLAGQPMTRLAMLGTNGALDASFSPPALDGGVTGVRYLDGRIIVWGDFTTVGGRSQRCIARFFLDGSEDPSFRVGAGASGPINVVLPKANGDYLVAGNFTSLKGVARNRIGELLGGAPPVSFVPSVVAAIEDNTTVTLTASRFGPATGAVSLAWQTMPGTALAGTDYQTASGTLSWADGDTADKSISVTLLDNAAVEATRLFTVAFSNPVGNILPGASAKVSILDDETPAEFTQHPQGARIYEGGSFTVTGAATSPTPVTWQWLLNGNPVPGATSASYSVTNATLAMAGSYSLRATNASGAAFSSAATVIVLHEASKADTSFALAPTLSAAPSVLLPVPGGGIYVGGNFSQYLLKLTAAGAVSPTSPPAPNGAVNALVLLPDGSLVVGGNFNQIGSTPSPGVAKVLPDGSVDAAFSANLGTGAGAAVNTLDVTPEGRIVVGGAFASFNNGAGTAYVTVLNADGTRDPLFLSRANGAVTTVRVQPDGKILLGGQFSSWQGAVRQVRVLPDGSRDFGYAQTATLAASTVNRAMPLSDGRILIAGSGLSSSSGLFLVRNDGSTIQNLINQAHLDALQHGNGQPLTLNGQTHPYLALRNLDSSLTNDTAFNNQLTFNGTVTAIATDASGGIWAGGNFTQFRGATTGRIVRLHGKPVDLRITRQPSLAAVPAGGTLQFSVEATSFSPPAYQWFRNNVALTDGGRVSGATTGTLSITAMEPGDEGDYHVVLTTPYATATSSSAVGHFAGVPEILAESTGRTVPQGTNFVMEATVIGSPAPSYVWTLNGNPISDGGPFSGATTTRLVVSGATAAEAGTYVLTATNAGGTVSTTPAVIAVIPPPADKHPTFSSLSSSSGAVSAILPLSGGRMLVAPSGNLSGGTGGTSSTSRLVLILPDGTVQTVAAGSTSGSITAMALAPDGKIVVYGTFTSILGQNRPGIARLNPDFTLDRSFNVEDAPPTGISLLAVDSQSRVLLGGSFSSYPGTPAKYLARLLPDGRADASFVPPTNTTPNGLVVLPGDKLWLTSASNGLLPGNHAAGVLNADGTVSFAISITSARAAATDAAGNLYLASNNSPGLFRYSSTGVADTAFGTKIQALGLSGAIQRAVVQPDGRIVLLGDFTAPRSRIMRIEADGTLDLSFDSGLGFTSNITPHGMELDPNGRIWIGSNFTSYNGSTTNRIVVLNGDATALGFVSQPQPAAVAAGQTATFQTTATGTSAISYQWFKDGSPLADGGNVSGATTASLAISSAGPGDEGNYQVEISNAIGTKSSAVVPLDLAGAPEFTFTPAGGHFEIITERAFKPLVRGSGTLSYQWYLGTTALADGADYSGTASDTLIILNPRESHSGTYRLAVSNGAGNNEVSIPVNFQRRPAKMDPDTALFISLANTPKDMIILPDGSRLFGGDFGSVSYVGGSSSLIKGIVHLKANGSVGTNDVNLYANSSFAAVNSLAIDSLGRVYVAGNFTTSNRAGDTNVTVNRLVRIVFDPVDNRWERDASFAIGAGPNSEIKQVEVDSSDRVLVGGSFGSFAGNASAGYLCRLNTDGSLDSTFDAPANATVNQFQLLPDGKILVAYGSTFSRLESNGTVDPGFTASGTNISRFLRLADGSTVVFRDYSYPTVTKLDATGAVVAGYPATASTSPLANGVTALHQQADGKLIVGGSFGSYDSVPVTNLIRLRADGTLDPTFDAGAGPNAAPSFIQTGADGRIHIGGAFTSYRGVNVSRYVVLNGGPEAPPADPFLDYLVAAGVPEGLRGDDDDADHDGIANLIEWLYQTGVNNAASRPQPFAGSSFMTGAAIGGAADPAKSYRVVQVEIPKNRLSLEVSVEVGLSLDDFGAGSATEFGTPVDNGTTETRSYFLTPAASDTPVLFWRLAVGR